MENRNLRDWDENWVFIPNELARATSAWGDYPDTLKVKMINSFLKIEAREMHKFKRVFPEVSPFKHVCI